MAQSYLHLPVMCAEILDGLAPALADPDPIVVDATLGLAGHAGAILDAFPTARLVGVDRDPQALQLATERLSTFGRRVETFEGTYDQLDQALDGRRAAAVVFDLGLSSLQIDAPERGFAYAHDAPLTMRMDADDTQVTAADVLNTYPVEDLARIFRVWGDETHAGRIARAIVAAREREPFTRSARLVDVVREAIPASEHRSGHPAKRVFQALRMEVNEERALLATALPKALDALRLGGRVAVLSYHSGEDRLVKQVFAEAASDHAPVGLPVVPVGHLAQFRLVTRGALKPTQAEIVSNPRSQSARLRVIERIRENP
ncbi:MAG: 16S rRNA (cytosine(1402)-N(4))-methyltransferase RsmH [Propionibacteriaceae bacterium]|jgi:16S rRNA (cytosine1402-N4)-methyltransferase|nr:16S rRNA (cytosine(1402)-N(4))-methyltransferase RsmH [Propionibacteriaceae bacterium]